VDSGNKEQLRELVGAITTPEAFYLYNGTELKDITVDGAAYAWRSSVPGNGADNPDDPMILTEDPEQNRESRPVVVLAQMQKPPSSRASEAERISMIIVGIRPLRREREPN
jgi:hypothetical protein